MQRSPDEDPVRILQSVVKPDALRGVVVAGDGDDRGLGVSVYPAEEVVEERDGLLPRRRAIKDVSDRKSVV